MIELATTEEHTANAANTDDDMVAMQTRRTPSKSLPDLLDDIAAAANALCESSPPKAPEEDGPILLHLAVWLTQQGMFPRHVAETLELFVLGEADSVMASSWMDAASDYPKELLGVFRCICKRYALRYCDEQCPKAWFRPCFLPDDGQAAFLKSV